MKHMGYITLALLVLGSAPLWAYTVSGKVYMGYLNMPVSGAAVTFERAGVGGPLATTSASDGSFSFRTDVPLGAILTLKATQGAAWAGSTTWICVAQAEVKDVHLGLNGAINPNLSIQLEPSHLPRGGTTPQLKVRGFLDRPGPFVMVQNFNVVIQFNPAKLDFVNAITAAGSQFMGITPTVIEPGKVRVQGQAVGGPVPIRPKEEFPVESFFDIFFEVVLGPEPAVGLEIAITDESVLNNDPSMNVPYLNQTDFLAGEPDPCKPLFLIDSVQDWETALNAERPNANIRPMPMAGWQEYMDAWQDPAVPKQGQPYPENTFKAPDLYVWGGGGGGGGCEEPGLVMVWGETEMPEGNYASAWRYDYGLDPDLSNCTIQVTVTPPIGVNITAVSFAMVDVNGNIRSWWWAVPAPIPQGIATTVSINTAQTGVAATNPVANGFMSMPGFDITKVQFFDVDENFNYVFGQLPAPPPGGGIAGRAWNYWSNLTVSKTTQAYKGTYVKWSQPPVLAPQSGGIPLINGWDERSVYRPTILPQQIMADDWLCTDQRPITDLHWWGSFIGWTQPYLPPVLPKAFHIGIWTDVPAVPGNPQSFSHPGTMIWEHICDKWVWNFAGYDVDPRLEPIQNEACFQFNQLLSQDEWFYQNPNGSPNGTVYWISIAAIYDAAAQVQYPWGWKTRPHFYNDDAVRIKSVIDATGLPIWPPVVGSTWNNGTPVEYPEGTSWDLAFELTTNQKAYSDDPIPGDIGGTGGSLTPDGAVDLNDLVILAAHWLMSAP